MRRTQRRVGWRLLLPAVVASFAVTVLGAPPALAAPPTITSFTPASGPICTTVTITGTGYQDASVVNSVTFNGTSASFTVNSNTQITATVPSGATDGPIAVTDSEATATSGTNFDVTGTATGPCITSFTPTSGPVGTSVTITGSGFSGATSVTFGGVAAQTFTVNSPTQITATVPNNAVTGPIAVTTPSGTSTSSTNFTVTGGGPTEHARDVSLNLRRHLVARGRVTSDDDACTDNVGVKIQRRRGGRWRTVANGTTNANGGFRIGLRDRVGRYRALVPRFSASQTDTCLKDKSPTERHRH